jgi:hypothetical protein
MLTETQVEKIIDLFWEEITDVSWDVWCDTSSTDKERIVPDVLFRLKDPTIDINEVYDLFWDWVEGLEPEDFSEDEEDDDDRSELPWDYGKHFD